MSEDTRLGWKYVRDYIRSRIQDFTYRPGDRLPRDEDVAKELGCTRSTVHRAMRSLVDLGLVERRRKGGTMVKADPVTRVTIDISITRLEIEERGYRYSHHVVQCKTINPSPSISARFGSSEIGKMLYVQGLHLADGRPHVCEDRWIVLSTVPEIKEVDFAQISANEWLVRNRPFSRCDVQIHAAPATVEEAELMQTDENEALLVLERTTWIGSAPITHVRAVHAQGYRLQPQAASFFDQTEKNYISV